MILCWVVLYCDKSLGHVIFFSKFKQRGKINIYTAYTGVQGGFSFLFDEAQGCVIALLSDSLHKRDD